MLLLFLLLFLGARRAEAIDHTFAASAQADYAFAPEDYRRPGNPQFDGATLELSMKLTADLSDHLSANVKVCFGCHGFEADMAYMDYRVADELNVRFGRFSPSFGAFNLRHDPANHRTSDKPLPYDMGRMLRLRDWNLGVLPAPFPNNGVEIDGTHWFGSSAQLDYATWAVTDFKGDYAGTDLDFLQSRSASYYYLGNNGIPTSGARLALTVKLGSRSDITFGASGQAGVFDPNRALWYVFWGGDATLRVGRTTIRAEYLARWEQFDPDSAALRFTTDDANAYFIKHGAYVELEQPLTRRVDFILRADGLLRVGDVSVLSALDTTSAVGRLTLGTAVLVERHLRLKASTELWEFTDPDVRGVKTEMSFHVGAVGTF